MQVQLESTTTITELMIDGVIVPARLWQGETAAGIPVFAWITRIAAARKDDLAEFDRDLKECTPPRPEATAFPLRMIL